MEFTDQQKQAIEMAVRRYEGGESMTVLTGLSGTGKTTIAREIVRQLGLRPASMARAFDDAKAGRRLRQHGTYLATAVSRRAATNLSDKGVTCRTFASTYQVPLTTEGTKELARLHEEEERLRRILDANPDDERAQLELVRVGDRIEALSVPDFAFQPANVDIADLHILEEASMIKRTNLVALLNAGARILAIGDGFQLPPISDAGDDDEDWLSAYPSDFHLTEIKRQGAYSNIVTTAAQIRAGGGLELQEHGDLIVRSPLHFNDWVQQRRTLLSENSTVTITATNNDRRWVNRTVREMWGRTTPEPQAGDTLICTRNVEIGGRLVANGDRIRIIAVKWDAAKNCFIIADSIIISRAMRLPPFIISVRQLYATYGVGNYPRPRMSRLPMMTVDFGFALTVHKAQGSEWDTVVVYGQHWGDAMDRARWTYTALTRARRLAYLFTGTLGPMDQGTLLECQVAG